MSPPSSPPPSPLTTALQSALQRRRQNSSLRTLTLARGATTDFSSNDFLSLSTSLHFRRAFLRELHAHPQLPLGSGGSRLLDGNSAYAAQLERGVATFLRGEAGLLFNSGFDANVGFWTCVPQSGDVVVFDELVHASVHEGMRLSRAGGRVKFAHNDVAGLRRVLREVRHEKHGGGQRNVFVAVETLYSMDGDLAPLREIVEAVEEAGAYLVVDEAHSTGVFGERGRGLVVQLGLERRVFARLHTFGKALACNGAIILCSPLVREYLINYARTLIFTTALSTPALAAIKAAFSMLQNGETEDARRRLHATIEHLHNLFATLPRSRVLALQNPHVKNTPILSVLTDRPRVLARYLQDGGFMVRPIVHPTVPRGKERVRICVHAANTVEEVEGLFKRIKEWVEQEEQKTDVDAVAEKAKL